MTETEETTWARAVDELDEILSQMEDDRMDLDELASRVQRAAELITWCRQRLTKTREDVDEIMATLTDESADMK